MESKRYDFYRLSLFGEVNPLTNAFPFLVLFLLFHEDPFDVVIAEFDVFWSWHHEGKRGLQDSPF